MSSLCFSTLCFLFLWLFPLATRCYPWLSEQPVHCLPTISISVVVRRFHRWHRFRRCLGLPHRLRRIGHCPFLFHLPNPTTVCFGHTLSGLLSVHHHLHFFFIVVLSSDAFVVCHHMLFSFVICPTIRLVVQLSLCISVVSLIQASLGALFICVVSVGLRLCQHPLLLRLRHFYVNQL